MCRPTANRPSRSEVPASSKTARIGVVDPSPADYQAWIGEAEAAGVELCFCSSADDALRLARTNEISVWVVNTTLVGLSGFELCAMLKTRFSRTPVYLVADQYSPEIERAALQARATMFGCKGEHLAWLRQWLGQRRAEPSRNQRGALLV